MKNWTTPDGERTGIVCGAMLLVVAAGAALAQEDRPADADYLRVVRAYADALLTHGRDTYGKTPSPLIASALDRAALQLGDATAIEGIRDNDRMLTGANPMHDQNLYQVLYALSERTGEKRYADEADRTLAWFFAHCQGPATGLLAWGEHMGWDFQTEQPIRDTHEFFRPWVLWERCYGLAPEACERFARGLWDHQIHDHNTGEFSRHAKWTAHGTGGDNEYPRHGGFYIATWAEAYKRTHDPVYAKAIETLVDYYNALSSPETGAIPCSSNPDRAKIMWPESNLSLAVDLWDGADKMPDALADTMRARASKTDEVFLKLAHDFGPDGIGFVSGANIDTLGPLTDGLWTHTQPWATQYGKLTDAQEAMLCCLRYRQVGLEGYRRLILGAAQRYLASDPNPDATIYPGPLGDVIFLMLAAHELTGDGAYAERAHHFARTAIALFVRDESPLPKASTQNDHYEAITRADTLMMALLRLWALEHAPHAKLSLVYNDR